MDAWTFQDAAVGQSVSAYVILQSRGCAHGWTGKVQAEIAVRAVPGAREVESGAPEMG